MFNKLACCLAFLQLGLLLHSAAAEPGRNRAWRNPGLAVGSAPGRPPGWLHTTLPARAVGAAPGRARGWPGRLAGRPGP